MSKNFLGNYILKYMYVYALKKPAAFVSQALLQLYARITKISWFEGSKSDWIFRNVVQDVSEFLSVCIHEIFYKFYLLTLFYTDQLQQKYNMVGRRPIVHGSELVAEIILLSLILCRPCSDWYEILVLL